MTTGATIHTTNGLMMKVRQRTRHPVKPTIPIVETAPASIAEAAMSIDQKGQLSTAPAQN